MKMWKMAYRNVRKYWRHYLIVGVFVFVGTAFLLSQLMIKESKQQTEQIYNQERYGTWFVSLPKVDYDELINTVYEDYDEYNNTYIPHTLKEKWDELIVDKDHYQYGFTYNQGFVEKKVVGYINKDDYSLFGIKLIEGNERQSEKDVIISSDASKELNLHIGDYVEIDIESPETYEIVGIFTNYNQDMPEIITNIEDKGEGTYYANNSVVRYDVGFGKYTFHYYVNIGGQSLPIDVPLQYKVNENGVDANQENVKFSTNFKKLQSFVQMIVLLSLVISVLTTTSLKRRSKESSLLRGIGATAFQLIQLTIYEMSIVLVVAMSMGLALAYGIYRYYGHMKTAVYGMYQYSFSRELILIYIIGIAVTIIFITFLPMRSAAIGALTGAFEAPKPKMLEGRESKWVPQTSRIMAKRQLSSYSKLTLALTLFVTFIGIYFITYRAQIASDGTEQVEKGPYDHKGYDQRTFYSNEDVETYKSFFQDGDTLTTIKQKDVNSTCSAQISLYDEDFVSKFELVQGSLPIANDEILINRSASGYEKVYYLEDYQVDFRNTLPLYEIDGKFTIDVIVDDSTPTIQYRFSKDEPYLSTDNYKCFLNFIRIDGQYYAYNYEQIWDIENDRIGSYIIFNPDGSSTEYKVDEHDTFSTEDTNDIVVVDGVAYKDFNLNFNEHLLYYRTNDQEDYQKIDLNGTHYTYYDKYIIVDGKIIYNYSLIKNPDGSIKGIGVYGKIGIGDTILIEEKPFKICGILNSYVLVRNGNRRYDEYQAYSNDNAYILSEAFEELNGKEKTQIHSIFDYDEVGQLKLYLRNKFNIESTEYMALFNTNYVSHNVINVSDFDPTYFLILIGAGTIMCIFLNLNSMLNDVKNIATLHLLGMSKGEIVKMHMNMALVMSLRVVVLVAVYFIFLLVGFHYTIDLFAWPILIIGAILFFSVVYVGPAIYITKNDLLEVLMAEGD